jgi:type I restriction enzyme S subunit
MMSEWQQCKLGDVLEIKYGKDHKGLNNGVIPVYGSGGIMRYADTALYEDESVLIPRKGSLNNIFYVNKPFWTVDTLFYTKPNKNIVNIKFLYYQLSQIDFNALNVGSAVPSLTVSVLNDVSVDLPLLPEQHAIANILSSLDDKIDLLHRQNKTLEAMAETLFRQWFIEEVEDLENATFGKWIETTFGGEWGKETPENEFITPVFCIRGTDIADLQTGLATKTPIRFIKKNKFESIEPKNGDLIIEISGGTENQSTGRLLYINAQIKSLYSLPIVFSNFCRLIRPFRQEYSFFVYCYIQYLYKQDEFFNLENGSSGIKNLNYKALLFELDYPMPDEKKVLAFDRTVKIYFEKINKNKKQIQTLEKLRDNLLPKLMSGEVRVRQND